MLSQKTGDKTRVCSWCLQKCHKMKIKRKNAHTEGMERGMCLLLTNLELVPLLYVFLVSGIPLSLLLSLAHIPPTHLSSGLMGHKVSHKCETLRASAGHPAWPKNLEASSCYESLPSSQATEEGNCFRAPSLAFESICESAMCLFDEPQAGLDSNSRSPALVRSIGQLS